MSTNLQNKSKGIPESITAIKVGAQLKALRLSLGLTGDVMAERLDISRGYLSELENDKSVLSDKLARVVAREFNVDFFTFEGKQVAKYDASADFPYPKFEPPEPLLVSENIKPSVAEPVAIPFYKSIKASAGKGSGSNGGEPPEVHVSFSPVYMRRHFGRTGDGFAMIYVKGDSMQPGLLDGDEIVIDTRQRRVDRDGIYVITLRGDLKVKRIQQRLDGSLVVKSDNDAYEAELVSAAHAEEFLVEGRLVWPRLR
jgi:phage repressor protein C with HTH and peptisase S24 domain